MLVGRPNVSRVGAWSSLRPTADFAGPAIGGWRLHADPRAWHAASTNSRYRWCRCTDPSPKAFAAAAPSAWMDDRAVLGRCGTTRCRDAEHTRIASGVPGSRCSMSVAGRERRIRPVCAAHTRGRIVRQAAFVDGRRPRRGAGRLETAHTLTKVAAWHSLKRAQSARCIATRQGSARLATPERSVARRRLPHPPCRTLADLLRSSFTPNTPLRVAFVTL